MKRPTTPSRERLAALATPLSGADAHVHLIPDGVFRATDGRPHGLDGWRLSPAIAERLLARIQAKQTRLAINYEHPQPTGEPLPAAGWIDRAAITYAEGHGLSAPVAWTARAKALIEAGEYAYLSPVIAYDGATGEVRDLHLAGLTNTPALDCLTPLAALAERLGLDLPTDPPDEDTSMDLAKLRQALGLAADADESVILTTAAELAATATQVAALTEQVNVLTARATPDLAGYVPKAVYEETLAALRRAQSEGLESEINGLIEQGLRDGRIPGQASADWLKSAGLSAIKQYLKDAPAMAALGATQTAGRSPEETVAPLTDEELAVCRQMQIDPADYRTAKAGKEKGQ